MQMSWSDDDSVIGSKYNHLNLRLLIHILGFQDVICFRIMFFYFIILNCRLVLAYANDISCIGLIMISNERRKLK